MAVQLGRGRIETGGVPLPHPPTPSCQDSSFPEWGTLRISMSRERSMGKGASQRAGVGRVIRTAFQRPAGLLLSFHPDPQPV
jgi:hypothetical protein